MKLARLLRGSVSAVIAVNVLNLAGCAVSRPAAVPQSAELKAQGAAQVVYLPDSDGTVWVTRQGTNDVVYSGRVMRGERVQVSPRDGVVSLNGRVVARPVAGARHDVWFLPGAAPAGTVVPAAARTMTLARPAGVPESATLSGEGTGRVEFRAPVDGMIWIADADTNELLYSGQVRRDQVTVLDPTKDTLEIGGAPLIQRAIPDHNYRIYYTSMADLPSGYAVSAPGTPVLVARPAEIPPAAALRGDGMGRLEFTADQNGNVWILDATTGSVVYSTAVLRGDLVVLDPSTNMLSVNGVRQGTRPIARDRYQLFFAPRI